MKLTFLGTGTSQGVPVIGCRCKVCCSEDSRDKRLRTSALLEVDGKRICIDAGPDFRQQMLRVGICHLDALLLTHEHKDHTGGIDDLRAFNFIDYPTVYCVPIYGTQTTLDAIRHDYAYAFDTVKYRGVPEIELCTISINRTFHVEGVKILPIEGSHSDRFRVTGYRVGPLAYLTDFSAIAPEEEAKLQGVECLVVNALRKFKHDSHFSLDEALELIRRVAPKRAYLTHISHDMGLYKDVERELPEGVFIAYDGLQIEI